MIILSAPVFFKNEIAIIHTLFETGMELFHVRKPDASENELKKFLTDIHPKYRPQIVLHNHHHLAVSFGIRRIHLTEFNRKKRGHLDSLFNNKDMYFSTSTHSIEDFNTLDPFFSYAFLSPLFESISKPGYGCNNGPRIMESLQRRSNFSTRLVGMGGITKDTISVALSKGCDDVALLGTIWNSNNPVQNFKECQKNFALTF